MASLQEKEGSPLLASLTAVRDPNQLNAWISKLPEIELSKCLQVRTIQDEGMHGLKLRMRQVLLGQHYQLGREGNVPVAYQLRKS